MNRRWFAAPLLGLALAVSSIGASAEGPTPHTPPSLDLPPGAEPSTEHLLLVADLMEQLAKTQELKSIPGVEDVVFDADTRVATLRVTQATPEVVKTVEQLNAVATSGFRAAVEVTEFTQEDWEALADDLVYNRSGWAEGLPGKPGGGYFPGKQKVIVTVMDYDQPERWKEAVAKRAGDRAEVLVAKEPIDGKTGEQYGRENDGWPRSGASELLYENGGSVYRCTAGFNWRKWGSTKTYGSTAEHCYGSVFVNGSNVWGNSVDTNYSTDFRVLSSSAAYGAGIWITSSATTPNIVATAKTTWSYGEVVAHSGVRTDYRQSKVESSNYTLVGAPGCGGGRRGVLMQTRTTESGDSGGPWFTARGDLKLIAHGQHWGIDCATGHAFFFKVMDISANAGHSLVTG